MTNRISAYHGTLADVERARMNIAFCAAMVRTHAPREPLSAWEIQSLHEVEGEATRVLRDFGLPLPWYESPSY